MRQGLQCGFVLDELQHDLGAPALGDAAAVLGCRHCCRARSCIIQVRSLLQHSRPMLFGVRALVLGSRWHSKMLQEMLGPASLCCTMQIEQRCSGRQRRQRHVNRAKGLDRAYKERM